MQVLIKNRSSALNQNRLTCCGSWLIQVTEFMELRLADVSPSTEIVCIRFIDQSRLKAGCGKRRMLGLFSIRNRFICIIISSLQRTLDCIHSFIQRANALNVATRTAHEFSAEPKVKRKCQDTWFFFFCSWGDNFLIRSGSRANKKSRISYKAKRSISREQESTVFDHKH